MGIVKSSLFIHLYGVYFSFLLYSVVYNYFCLFHNVQAYALVICIYLYHNADQSWKFNKLGSINLQYWKFAGPCLFACCTTLATEHGSILPDDKLTQTE